MHNSDRRAYQYVLGASRQTMPVCEVANSQKPQDARSSSMGNFLLISGLCTASFFFFNHSSAHAREIPADFLTWLHQNSQRKFSLELIDACQCFQRSTLNIDTVEHFSVIVRSHLNWLSTMVTVAIFFRSCSRSSCLIIGSAEALPLLCVSDFCERWRERRL